MVFAGEEHNSPSHEKDEVAKSQTSRNEVDWADDARHHQSPSRKGSPGNVSLLPDRFTNLPSKPHHQPGVGSFEFVVDVQPEALSKRRDESTGLVPITLKFEDVEYSVTVTPQTSWFEYKNWSYKSLVPSVPSLCNKKKPGPGLKKQILHGISGIVKPGEILAMLGPSGSGKTSLLSVLGGRVTGDLPGRKLSGQILFNDSKFGKGMKRRTGFVMQDDILFQHLTVKETLVYAAYLRLPTREFTKSAKVQRAEDVLTELGLQKCKDTVIGGPFVRGISGGERKRVSIGNEMLTDPSLLLLDEPTSGLDSTIALKIIHTLQDLAKGGRTVITTIHQPSSIIFHTFTKLLLLSEGHTLYYGLGSEAMNYFQSVGFEPSFATNPADFLLDLASGLTYDVIDTNNREPTAEVRTGKERNSRDQSGPGPQEVLITLREAYVKTLLSTTRKSINNNTTTTDEEYKASLERRKWPTTWTEQCSILISRGIKERRHEVFAGLRIFQVTAVSIICGLLWWQSTPENIQDQVGLLFFMTTFWGFFPMFTAIFIFPVERQMMTKERVSGMYKLSAYFLARTGGELPLELVLPTISVIIVYWMGGLKKSASSFIAYLMVTLSTVLVSQGLGQFLGAALMEIKQATTISSVLLLTTQLAGGYFVQSTPAWIGWIKYLSFAYYAYKLQLVTQYTHSQTYQCATGRCLIAAYPAVSVVGLNKWGTSLMALFIMMIGYRVLAYLSLRRMKLS